MQKVKTRDISTEDKHFSALSAKFEEMKCIFNFKMQEFEYNEKLNLQILGNFQSKLAQLESTNLKLKDEIDDCRTASIEALTREAEYTKLIQDLKELLTSKENYIEQLESRIKNLEKIPVPPREHTKEDLYVSDDEKIKVTNNNERKPSNNIRVVVDNEVDDYKDKYLKLKGKVQEYKQHKKAKADFIDKLQEKLSNLESQYSTIIEGMNEQIASFSIRLKQESGKVSLNF